MLRAPQNGDGVRQFRFSNLFESSATTEQVYHASCSRMVRMALQGVNSTVFAYGQTGTGKTYTMYGDGGDGGGDGTGGGIAGMIAADLFATIGTPERTESEHTSPGSRTSVARAVDASGQTRVSAGGNAGGNTSGSARGGVPMRVEVAYLQIYNTHLTDLLDNRSDDVTGPLHVHVADGQPLTSIPSLPIGQHSAKPLMWDVPCIAAPSRAG